MYVTDTLHQPSADCEAPDSMERTHSSETAHPNTKTKGSPGHRVVQYVKKKMCTNCIFLKKKTIKSNQNPLCLCRSIHREII